MIIENNDVRCNACGTQIREGQKFAFFNPGDFGIRHVHVGNGIPDGHYDCDDMAREKGWTRLSCIQTMHLPFVGVE